MGAADDHMVVPHLPYSGGSSEPTVSRKVPEQTACIQEPVEGPIGWVLG